MEKRAHLEPEHEAALRLGDSELYIGYEHKEDTTTTKQGEVIPRFTYPCWLMRVVGRAMTNHRGKLATRWYFEPVYELETRPDHMVGVARFVQVFLDEGEQVLYQFSGTVR